MYLKLIIFFLLFVLITSNSLDDWQKFKHDYNKQYASIEEETERKQIFFENVNGIKNYQKNNPNATFTIGINHLADRRIEELVSNSQTFFNKHLTVSEKLIQPKLGIPLHLDWRDKNVITPVYSQGPMGKDKAFAAVEVIESYQAIQSKRLLAGSIAQVSNCCPDELDVFDCILQKLDGGICEASAFSPSITTCDKNACQPFARFNRINRIESGREDLMLSSIQESPLYISIDASLLSFQFYQIGVYRERTCSKTQNDHVLQLIGYGTMGGIPYWICKNSWGTPWGDKGYILIERGSNTCGIALTPVQIEYKTSSNAVRLFLTNHIYLAFLCLILHLLSNLK